MTIKREKITIKKSNTDNIQTIVTLISKKIGVEKREKKKDSFTFKHIVQINQKTIIF